MKKYMLDMKVTENCSLHKNYCLLKLTSDQILPEMLPGQFVQVRVDNSPTTFLRRPISINYVDRATNELWLLVQLVGDGTRRMAEYKPGDVVNIMLQAEIFCSASARNGILLQMAIFWLFHRIFHTTLLPVISLQTIMILSLYGWKNHIFPI